MLSYNNIINAMDLQATEVSLGPNINAMDLVITLVFSAHDFTSSCVSDDH